MTRPDPTDPALAPVAAAPVDAALGDGAPAAPGKCPVAPPTGLRRRAFLRGAGLTTALGAGALAGAFAAGADATTAPDPSGRTIPFHGPHQAGITTPPQAAASFVSFTVIAPDRAGLRQLLGVLTDRIGALTAGGPVPATDLASPPTDSATLGPVLPSDGLTVTVGVGASLFDGRFGLAGRKPARLVEMPAFPDDDLVGSKELHGDLSLQICADSRDTVMHALRDITRHTRGLMQASWKVDGFHAAPRPSGTPRNQLGFKDGIANPDTGDAKVTDAVLWTHGGANGEPAWVEGGSYQVIRIIRMLVEFWDRVSLHEQETMIGRRRDSGAPLDGTVESDLPNYQADPQGLIVPMTAHIRLANPRTADTADQLILRRGYNYERGLDLDGNLDVGLVFCCYQQDVNRQFTAVQQRLAGEPLVDYISPTGGGYFFALPGVKGPGDRFGSALLA
ncbi:iron uptake transporter deferrochelatase/peroxidase subunit [Kitasatospora sp. NBC_01287]|uniref:iron uptake transporter deferrochelatase/peroxidase subunit n=1 Tax=Kitasatospora sp. NBC_01287 TaxID=2903573 RepID=UPI00225987B7|nr:iron uptake transporter deferrochelatase/peroxidase subunit [Kitasatospora sp. NBC_01287]MCX4745731.1 iron uptake transporter deferrochelatase/peroxidase subunit [Kitasatospora sp. NBC_01287]